MFIYHYYCFRLCVRAWVCWCVVCAPSLPHYCSSLVICECLGWMCLLYILCVSLVFGARDSRSNSIPFHAPAPPAKYTLTTHNKTCMRTQPNDKISATMLRTSLLLLLALVAMLMVLLAVACCCLSINGTGVPSTNPIPLGVCVRTACAHSLFWLPIRHFLFICHSLSLLILLLKQHFTRQHLTFWWSWCVRAYPYAQSTHTDAGTCTFADPILHIVSHTMTFTYWKWNTKIRRRINTFFSLQKQKNHGGDEIQRRVCVCVCCECRCAIRHFEHALKTLWEYTKHGQVNLFIILEYECSHRLANILLQH